MTCPYCACMESEPDYLPTGECVMFCSKCLEIVWREHSKPKDTQMNYIFERYRKGKKMAEGAKVTAVNKVDALKKAKALFKEKSCRNDEFRIQKPKD